MYKINLKVDIQAENTKLSLNCRHTRSAAYPCQSNTPTPAKMVTEILNEIMRSMIFFISKINNKNDNTYGQTFGFHKGL